jgi:hypothetical protein
MHPMCQHTCLLRWVPAPCTASASHHHRPCAGSTWEGFVYTWQGTGMAGHTHDVQHISSKRHAGQGQGRGRGRSRDRGRAKAGQRRSTRVVSRQH